MRFVEGAERAAHLRADGLSTLQSQPRNVGRTAAAPTGRQTHCGGLKQTGSEQRPTCDLISFCFDLDRQTVLLQLSLCDRSSFSFSPTLSTLWSHRISLHNIFEIIRSPRSCLLLPVRDPDIYPLLRSAPIDFDLLGVDTSFCLHTDCSLHTFRELSVFFKFDFVGLRP